MFSDGLRAGDRHLHAVAGTGAAAVADADDAGLQHGQLRPVASVERKLADGGAADVVAQRRRPGVDGRRLAGHHDVLVELSDLHLEVDRVLGPDGERQPFLRLAAEAIEGDHHFVRTGQQVGNAVEPFCVRDDAGDHAGRDVGDGDAGVRQRARALIAHAAHHRAAHGLRG